MKNSTLAAVLIFIAFVLNTTCIVLTSSILLQIFFGIIDVLIVVMFGMVLNDIKVKS